MAEYSQRGACHLKRCFVWYWFGIMWLSWNPVIIIEFETHQITSCSVSHWTSHVDNITKHNKIRWIIHSILLCLVFVSTYQTSIFTFHIPSIQKLEKKQYSYNGACYMWISYPYVSGLIHWHPGNHIIGAVPVIEYGKIGQYLTSATSDKLQTIRCIV